jgi:hypothetical protein
MREAKAINVAGMATINVMRKPRMPRNVNIVFYSWSGGLELHKDN